MKHRISLLWAKRKNPSQGYGCKITYALISFVITFLKIWFLRITLVHTPGFVFDYVFSQPLPV